MSEERGEEGGSAAEGAGEEVKEWEAATEDAEEGEFRAAAAGEEDGEGESPRSKVVSPEMGSYVLFTGS